MIRYFFFQRYFWLLGGGHSRRKAEPVGRPPPPPRQEGLEKDLASRAVEVRAKAPGELGARGPKAEGTMGLPVPSAHP